MHKQEKRLFRAIINRKKVKKGSQLKKEMIKQFKNRLKLNKSDADQIKKDIKKLKRIKITKFQAIIDIENLKDHPHP